MENVYECIFIDVENRKAGILIYDRNLGLSFLDFDNFENTVYGKEQEVVNLLDPFSFQRRGYIPLGTDKLVLSAKEIEEWLNGPN